MPSNFIPGEVREGPLPKTINPPNYIPGPVTNEAERPVVTSATQHIVAPKEPEPITNKVIPEDIPRKKGKDTNV